jgi:hypothetical protein
VISLDRLDIVHRCFDKIPGEIAMYRRPEMANLVAGSIWDNNLDFARPTRPPPALEDQGLNPLETRTIWEAFLKWIGA